MWKIILPPAFVGCLLLSSIAEGGQKGLLALSRTETQELAPTVVQNRFFSKKLRAEAGASFGSVLNESYSQTKSVGARLGLFLNETSGIEYNYARFTAQDSSDLTSLRSQEICFSQQCRSIEPSFIRFNSMHQLQWVVAPIYGKINLLDSIILYSDLTLSAGVARANTSQGDKWAFTPGIGQRFYFSKSFSLRVDVSDIYLKETIADGTRQKENWRHNWVAQAGVSVFLNAPEQ